MGFGMFLLSRKGNRVADRVTRFIVWLVQGMLKTGVGAVDTGQTEAAYALGFSDRQTFFRIVLPQALPHIMPTFTGQVTTLIKATAIVGYIAVQDLTKMGDLIRSRTYEA